MSRLNPFAAVLGAAVVSSSLSMSSMAENPFHTTDLQSGYQLASNHSAGEGKCGEAKCGAAEKPSEGKCGEDKCCDEDKSSEGKCGEGKCGEGRGGES